MYKLNNRQYTTQLTPVFYNQCIIMNPNRETSADQQGPLIAKNAQEKINAVAQNFGGLWRLVFFVGAVGLWRLVFFLLELWFC